MRPSACPSVTLRDCIKTAQARITKSSPLAAPKNFSFLWRNFVPLGEGFSLERGRQSGYPPKKFVFYRNWLAGSPSLKTVADRHINMLFIITSRDRNGTSAEYDLIHNDCVIPKEYWGGDSVTRPQTENQLCRYSAIQSFSFSFLGGGARVENYVSKSPTRAPPL